MFIKPIKTEILNEGDDLFAFITKHISQLKENSIIAITSKIVALAEKRVVIVKNNKAKEKLIKAESDFCLSTKYVWMTLKDGMIMASAGIDESNADGKLILLPKNSFKTANLLRKKLTRRYKIKNIGVLITDSRTTPLRSGVTGVALGYAGFKGIKDYAGKPDIFGRKFKFSRVNIADCLATAAVLVMGEGREQQPLAIIKNAPIEFCSKTKSGEIEIALQDDIYLPMSARLLPKFRKK